MRKLSDLNTDECLNVLCEITPYVSNIVSDEEIMGTLGRAVEKKDMTAIGVMIAGIGRIARAIPLLLKNHRNDVYEILSVIGEMTVEEIAAQNSMVTLAQLRTVCKDKVLIDFFKSWVRGEETE